MSSLCDSDNESVCSATSCSIPTNSSVSRNIPRIPASPFLPAASDSDEMTSQVFSEPTEDDLVSKVQGTERRLLNLINSLTGMNSHTRQQIISQCPLFDEYRQPSDSALYLMDQQAQQQFSSDQTVAGTAGHTGVTGPTTLLTSAHPSSPSRAAQPHRCEDLRESGQLTSDTQNVTFPHPLQQSTRKRKVASLLSVKSHRMVSKH